MFALIRHESAEFNLQVDQGLCKLVHEWFILP